MHRLKPSISRIIHTHVVLTIDLWDIACVFGSYMHANITMILVLNRNWVFVFKRGHSFERVAFTEKRQHIAGLRRAPVGVRFVFDRFPHARDAWTGIQGNRVIHRGVRPNDFVVVIRPTGDCGGGDEDGRVAPTHGRDGERRVGVIRGARAARDAERAHCARGDVFEENIVAMLRADRKHCAGCAGG